MIYERDFSGYKYHYKYDENGNKIYSIDNTKLETWYEYDDAGNLIRFYDSDGYETRYEYNENNQCIHMIDVYNNPIEEWYEYDDAGNMIHRKTSNGLEEFLEYDDNGNKIHYRNNSGVEYFYKYNSDGRLIYSESNMKLIHLKYSRIGNQCKSEERVYLYEYEYVDSIPIDFEKISSGVFKCVYRFKRRVYNELRIDFSKNGDIQLFSPSGDIIATVEDLSDLAKILTDLSKGSLR